MFGAGFYVLYRIVFVILAVTRWGLGIGHWIVGVSYQVCWMLCAVYYIFCIGCWGIAGWLLRIGCYRLGIVFMGWDIRFLGVLYGVIVT